MARSSTPQASLFAVEPAAALQQAEERARVAEARAKALEAALEGLAAHVGTLEGLAGELDRLADPLDLRTPMAREGQAEAAFRAWWARVWPAPDPDTGCWCVAEVRRGATGLSTDDGGRVRVRGDVPALVDVPGLAEGVALRCTLGRGHLEPHVLAPLLKGALRHPPAPEPLPWAEFGPEEEDAALCYLAGWRDRHEGPPTLPAGPALVEDGPTWERLRKAVARARVAARLIHEAHELAQAARQGVRHGQA